MRSLHGLLGSCSSTMQLSDVLSACQGGELGRTAGLPYRFEFYLKRSLERDQPAPDVSTDAHAAGLEHVAVTLPPPVRACLGCEPQRSLVVCIWLLHANVADTAQQRHRLAWSQWSATSCPTTLGRLSGSC